MLATRFNKPFDITVEEVPDPRVVDPTDVTVEILYTAICGSDLWTFRGIVPHAPGGIGHEFMGRVLDIGTDVSSVRPGDAVIAPFVFSEGDCEQCRNGLQPLCERSGIWGKDWAGAQAEAIRVPFADATLVPLPWSADELDTELARRLMPLCDVYATGTHGAVLAGVGPGDTVAVIGDGAVGISAAAAARRMGAGRVVLLGEQPARLAIAEGFDVETLRVSRDESSVARVREVFGGRLPDRVVECVGMQSAFDTALDVAAPGGSVGFVGVPHGVEPIPPMRLFGRQIQVCGGVAPARRYLPGLIDEVRTGGLDPSPLMDRTLALTDAAAGYEAMDTGAALKVLLTTAGGSHGS
ncbi:alcohol dehydrogenase catalytic domain-containing protein [Streptomyces sp. NBC_00690]|uniref:alcohol dehydrogenase catalytic domain-containing protein n=1 Tax=Streptomyces sp. NBC_00690 TaxID=2975808 RepID=UPI002E2D4432|nr:alcohol dehydrogenase catalytic domain-containing protein [Streptomyces sp. NBC_00690]